MRTCQHATCKVPRARVIRRYGGYAAMHFAVMLLCRYAPMPLCSYAREVLRGPLFRHLSSFLIPALTHPIPHLISHFGYLSTFPLLLAACPICSRESPRRLFSTDEAPNHLPSPIRAISPSLIAHSS